MLPQWLTDLVPVVPWLIAIILLIWLIVRLYPSAKKLINFIDDVAGEEARPGVEARLGLMERMANFEDQQGQIKQRLDVVHHELFPNSGKSLRDQTNRIELKLNTDDERLIEVNDKVDKVTANVDTLDSRIVSLEDALNEHLSVSTDILTTIKEEK